MGISLTSQRLTKVDLDASRLLVLGEKAVMHGKYLYNSLEM